ncbi:DUF6545 domain-containing protein [Nocardia sp. CA-119907]|uniref:DUF6545 domain-containing protein n=1 Tax=Nocardia sp. CA-119907 TaxID=3239973 RepID=UPI003D956EF2
MSCRRDRQQYRIDSEADLFAQFRRRPAKRAQFESIVDRLELPQDWTVMEFFDRLARIRGRAIVQCPLPEHAPLGLFGLWLARPHDDAVLYRRASDPMLEWQVVVHELAHMLLDHRHEKPTGELAELLAGVDLDDGFVSDASMIRGARSVSGYSDHAEYEAELLATMIMARTHTHVDEDGRAMLRLYPVWRDLTSAAPGVVLTLSRSDRRGASRAELLHRRRVEILDAAVIVGRYAGPLPEIIDEMIEASVSDNDDHEALRCVAGLACASWRLRAIGGVQRAGDPPLNHYSVPSLETLAQLWKPAQTLVDHAYSREMVRPTASSSAGVRPVQSSLSLSAALRRRGRAAGLPLLLRNRP